MTDNKFLNIQTNSYNKNRDKISEAKSHDDDISVGRDIKNQLTIVKLFQSKNLIWLSLTKIQILQIPISLEQIFLFSKPRRPL